VAATRVIEIRTDVPGPRSREILEREQRAVAHPLTVHQPIVADRARGSTITDVDGNTFVDFVGGVGVVNVGHNHPRVLEAIAEQADRFLHTDFTVVPYEGYVELAERLGVLVPIT
jgi:4-aminobutyrate aminotransferase / (S)-3-amino-2-methylpropionate transaminase / 5-aminovalerate transaminase